jgi:hypothetical protein
MVITRAPHAGCICTRRQSRRQPVWAGESIQGSRPSSCSVLRRRHPSGRPAPARSRSRWPLVPPRGSGRTRMRDDGGPITPMPRVGRPPRLSIRAQRPSQSISHCVDGLKVRSAPIRENPRLWRSSIRGHPRESASVEKPDPRASAGIRVCGEARSAGIRENPRLWRSPIRGHPRESASVEKLDPRASASRLTQRTPGGTLTVGRE